jgi:AcrR family transcriptional regulator
MADSQVQTVPGQELCPKPLRADARRNRARLLAAAEKVLGEQGLTAPIDEIAHEAGVGVGTVYRHFPTKEALLEAIVVAHFEPLIEEANALLGADDPVEAFFTFLADMIRAAGHKALATAIAEADPEVRERRAEWSATLTKGMRQLLAAAQQTGAIRSDVSIEDVRAMLGGICIAQDRMSLSQAQGARSLAILRSGLCDTSGVLPD